LVSAILVIAFGCVAAVYSAAGFGGGSAYLALLALAAMPTRQAAVVALLCNVVVVARTCLAALRLRLIDWASLAAFACLSVPAALVGASYPIKDRHLDLLLACTLLFSALALVGPKRTVEPGDVRHRSATRRLVLGAMLGMPLGLIGGLVGIGGGVFLSPVLHFLRWNTSRHIATLCSAFILLNSVAGLVGKRAMWGDIFALHAWWALPIAVWLGGTLGTRLLLTRLSNRWITRATAAVVFFASMQTFYRVWS
jgi:uncharacterized protein